MRLLSYMNFDPAEMEAPKKEQKPLSEEEKSKIEQQIEHSLEKVRPYLHSEGGDVEFVAFDDKTGIVQVRLQGACSHCAISTVTLKMGIEQSVMEDVPEVKGVIQV
jgi:Fe-S cluster biogenesis protein NfuA